MRDIIVNARPAVVAAVGIVPFVVAVAAIALQPWTETGRMVFALSVYGGVLLVLLWSWIVGHALNLHVEPEHRPGTTGFRIAVLYVAVYAGMFVATLGALGVAPLTSQPIVFAALHLVAMFASAAVLHFVGSNLALAEGEPANSSTWTTTLSLFSIGGILAVQQRVNQVFANETAG